MSDKGSDTFNTFTADWKNRVETLIKTVMLLSGGVMSITIGAYIETSGPRPAIPESGLSVIRWSWYLLSSSLVASLLTFFTIVISGSIVLFRWQKVMHLNAEDRTVIDSPLWLRMLAWSFGVFAVLSCAVGLALVAQGATYLLA